MTIQSSASIGILDIQNNYQRKSDPRSSFDALSKALSSGDLSAAQSAFASLQQNAPQAPFGADGNGQASKDFAALGKALSSGDLSAAKSAFATIQSHLPKGTPQFGAAGANQSQDQALKDFEVLAKALSSGNIQSAKDALATIQKHAKKQEANASSSASSFQNSLAQIQTALNNGNVNDAKLAFQSFLTNGPSGARASGLVDISA